MEGYLSSVGWKATWVCYGCTRLVIVGVGVFEEVDVAVGVLVRVGVFVGVDVEV
jgi:hypothetical protein